MNFKLFIDHYVPYVQKRLGFSESPKINFVEDEENALDPLGKTGHYNPVTMEIVVYTTGRHPKDIMRSFSHELIHHAQNCRGDLTSQKVGEVGDNYAQTNKHLRNMEREAYDLGNIYFRDWCDSHKGKFIMEKVEKEAQPLNEWLNDERFGLLMNKFGILSEAKKKKPMKQDKKDFDGDKNTTEMIPAYLDKDDVKKKKTSGKVPPQLQKHVKAKQEKSDKKDLEEKKMTKAEKKEEEKLGKKMEKAGVKSKMKEQYGKKKGEQVYYATKRKKAMEDA